MSFWKSATSFVDKVSDAIGFTNTTTGVAKLIEDATGMSPSQQYTTGGTVGLANMLSNNVLNTGTADGSNGNNAGSSLLSTIFGSGDNSLSSILGSVVKGAVGIGADYFSNQQYYKDQRRLNEQTFEQGKWLARQKYKYDTRAADTAYQRDVAMWNMQNAYNAPSAQMERLQKAGLNPNLVYGGGSVTGNTAGSPPSYTPASYPQVSAPSSKAQKLDLMRSVLGIFDEYQSIRNQALENQRANARIALQEEQMRLNEKRLDLQESNEERRFQIMLANLGIARNKAEEPKSWIGRNWADIKSVYKDIFNPKGTKGHYNPVRGYRPRGM